MIANNPDEMGTINIWAKLSNVADARKNPSAPGATVDTVTICTDDGA